MVKVEPPGGDDFRDLLGGSMFAAFNISSTLIRNISALRRAMDTDEPITVCSRVVSVVMRD